MDSSIKEGIIWTEIEKESDDSINKTYGTIEICICPECSSVIYEEDYLFADYKDELPICPFCESALD